MGDVNEEETKTGVEPIMDEGNETKTETGVETPTDAVNKKETEVETTMDAVNEKETEPGVETTMNAVTEKETEAGVKTTMDAVNEKETEAGVETIIDAANEQETGVEKIMDDENEKETETGVEISEDTEESQNKDDLKCKCDSITLLGRITKKPEKLDTSEINDIRLNLFTERNSDGTGYLVLRGKDIENRYKRRIMDSDIRAICKYIKQSPRRIIMLDLSYNRITDKGFIKLLKKILVKGRSSIINLNIMNNRLSAESIFHLANYAKYVKLIYLRLNGNKFGSKGGEYFAKFLINNKTVEYCDIGETSQTLSSVAQVISALRKGHGENTTLRVFDFSRIIPMFNRYSYETKWFAYHIEYLLENNSSIVELHLQKNEFISHDVEYFVRGLRKNNTLLYLDLGFNKIGDYGIELIAKYLAEGPQLVLLNVAGNSINDFGARALSFGMPYSKIRALDISHNRLTDAGLLDILNTVKKPYFLRFLNIWGNKIGPPTCEIIQRMLESGVLFQHTMDVKLYEVDEALYAAYYPNPANRNKHLYYNEMDFGVAQPIYHITRNVIGEKKKVKVDCKQRHKLDKTDRNNF